MDNHFENYEKLVVKVDELCRSIETRLAGHLACRSGCSGCCCRFTLFPVEAHTLKRAYNELSGDDKELVRQNLETASGVCPLLKNNLCLVYQARPIICRTHGLPILYSDDGIQKIDCCPENDLSGLNICGSELVDIDRLNSLLVAVNTFYLKQTADNDLPVRLSITEILLPEKP